MKENGNLGLPMSQCTPILMDFDAHQRNIQESFSCTAQLKNMQNALSIIADDVLYNKTLSDDWLHHIWTRHRPCKEDIALICDIAVHLNLDNTTPAWRRLTALAHSTGLVDSLLARCTNDIKSGKRVQTAFERLKIFGEHSSDVDKKNMENVVYKAMLYSSSEWNMVDFKKPETVEPWIKTPEYNLWDAWHSSDTDEEMDQEPKKMSAGRWAYNKLQKYDQNAPRYPSTSQERAEKIDEDTLRKAVEENYAAISSLHDLYLLPSWLQTRIFNRIGRTTTHHSHLPLITKLKRDIRDWGNYVYSIKKNIEQLYPVDIKTFRELGGTELDFRKSNISFDLKTLSKHYTLKHGDISTYTHKNNTIEMLSLGIYHPHHVMRQRLYKLYAAAAVIGAVGVFCVGNYYFGRTIDSGRTGAIIKDYNAYITPSNKTSFDFCLQTWKFSHSGCDPFDLTRIPNITPQPPIESALLSGDSIKNHSMVIDKMSWSDTYYAALGIGGFALGGVVAVISAFVGAAIPLFRIDNEDKPLCTLIVRPNQIIE
jgi:hypothetical protein